jgi:hypothetical protein
MLAHMLRVRGLRIDEDAIEHVARRTEGYDSSDLAVVIERAVHQMRLTSLLARSSAGLVTQQHWDAALSGFQPSAAWEAGTKDTIDARCARWGPRRAPPFLSVVAWARADILNEAQAYHP